MESTAEGLDQEGTFDGGVEPEEEEGGEEVVEQPYNPAKAQIVTKLLTLDLLVRRIAHQEIDMAPEFQRKAGLWSSKRMSRLIESLLIRIPLPSFYFDASDDSRWVVVDGLQRLTAFEKFMVEKTLRLEALEYLRAQEGKTFLELPRDLQRRIEETQVTVHLIQPGTPTEVKFNIFSRINTGGLVLNTQEIRHALYQGKVTPFLAELAGSPEFKAATARGVPDNRMLDREFVLRFLTFSITPYSQYKGPLDVFLAKHMEALNARSDADLARLRERFLRAMRAAHAIFGNDAFRKRYAVGEKRRPINKALFETWAVHLGVLSEDDLEILAVKKQDVRGALIRLFKEDADFDKAVSQGTGDTTKVEKRFRSIEQLIRKVLSGDSG